jgi:hypothetical protein
MRPIIWRLLFMVLAVAALAAGTTTPVDAAFINGSFETGNFSGWTRTAYIGVGSPDTGGPTYQTFIATQAGSLILPDTNAVVSSQTTNFDGNGPSVSTPAIGPTDGRFLAFLSNATSAGDGTLTASSISQTFSVPTGSSSLSLDLRLLNNDDAGFFADNNDFGGVALLRGGTVLKQYNLDLDQFSNSNGHVTADTLQGGFFNSTPWNHVSFDLTGLSGQNLTLAAYVMNYGGDNFGETRLLIDNVNTAGAVPEPSSVVTFGISLVMLAGYTLCRRHFSAAR